MVVLVTEEGATVEGATAEGAPAVEATAVEATEDGAEAEGATAIKIRRAMIKIRGAIAVLITAEAPAGTVGGIMEITVTIKVKRKTIHT